MDPVLSQQTKSKSPLHASIDLNLRLFVRSTDGVQCSQGPAYILPNTADSSGDKFLQLLHRILSSLR